MDYPKSVPSVGLVNGKFVDENPVTGTPGSLVPASWGNGVTQEILNVLAAAGITPEEQKTDQLALALSVLNDWVKLKNKPTTLAGYGITDALQVGRTSRQRPSLSAMDLTDAGTGLGGALEIREAQEVGATQTRYEYAPKILFHWQGLVAKSLAMNSDGELAWAGQKLWNAANFNPDGKANKATTLAGYGITDGVSALSFLKPVAGQWVLLGGSGVLPAGGTWAFYCTNYNGNGAALGGNAGVAAGGTSTGNGNCVGFAWRIQ
jgi:hypothetical protein